MAGIFARTGRLAIVGGGPAGLFLARMVRLSQPGVTVDVYERNHPDDVSGFGVALTGGTLRGLAAHDPATHQRIRAAGVALSGVELRLPGETVRCAGFPLFTISRHVLLTILREQAAQAGARLHFGQEVTPGEVAADVVAVADGARSGHRTAHRDAFGTEVRLGAARYIWLATSAAFPARTTFAFARTEHGPMAVHAYPYGAGMSTVVVETDEATWHRAGLAPAAGTGPPAPISAAALARLGEIFAEQLNGLPLVGNHSRWDRFPVVTNAVWSVGNTVLLGDAAHTAHFTVGSGTRMALADAIVLAGALAHHDGHAAAFAAYERQRRPSVHRVQRQAEPSRFWWETFGRRLHLPPAQFALHFLTRTGAVTYPVLADRCADRIVAAEADFHRVAGTGNAAIAPMRLGQVRLPNRIVALAGAGPVPGPAPGLVLPGAVLPDAVLSDAVLPDGATAGGAPEHPCLVAVGPPHGPEWADRGDDLVARARAAAARGAAGVLVRPDLRSAGWWHTMIGHADRIRTEVGIAVAVCVPADWRPTDPAAATDDNWAVRVHLALISGRIDLVVRTPMTPAEQDRAVQDRAEQDPAATVRAAAVSSTREGSAS